MTEKIVEQAKHVLDGIEIGYFDTGGSYEFQEEYYKYFGDPDFQTRKYALAVFTRMLGDWDSGVSFVFVPMELWREIKESKKDRNIGEEPYYYFDDYLKAFLNHHKNIEKEFPVMYEYIIKFLIQIEEKKGISYEDWFSEIDPKLFKKLRTEVLIPKSNLKDQLTPIKYFFKEVGIVPFFKSDLSIED